MRAVALRYALAPACILLAVLLYLSPVGPFLHPTGLLVFAIIAAAWFGGTGPGMLAAVLATFALPQLISMSYPLVGGVFDLPRFITFSIAGLAVGWWGLRRRQVEAALRESEERYALAMEAAGDGHTDWNLETGKHYISPGLLKICGYAPGTTFRDRAEWVRRFPFHPEDRPKWEAAIASHFAGRESHFKMELRIVVRGEVRWTAFHFLSTRDAAGRPIRWTGSIADITEQKRVEEALRASQQRYGLAMEAAEEGYVDSDIDTDQFVTSERWNEIFGIPRGKRFADRSDFLKHFRFYGDDGETYGDMISAVGKQGGPDRYEFEFRIVLGSGEVRWLWTRGKVTRDAEGRARRRIGVVADITARKLAEEARRVSEERFALAVAGSYDGVWDIDFVARSVFFSARTRELCGLPPGPEVVPLDGWFEALPLHPEDRPRRTAAIQAHLSGKAPVYEGEFRFLQPDGVYRWRHLHGVCVRDAGGKPLRMAGSISDVDARRRAEDGLRESEQRYELAMAASESGYWDWHIPTDRYHTSPRAFELSGYPPGTKWVTRKEYSANINMHPEDLARWEAAREELFAGTGERLAMEVRYIVRGETRWHILQAICRRDDTGKVIRWTGSTTDITDRKRAEEEVRTMERKLRQAQRLEAMGTLAGGIAHDFNNILGAILGNGEMALRDAPKGSRLARDLETIMVAGERGRALVERVLTFSRSAVGKVVPVHVEMVVREVLDLILAKLPPNVTVHPRLHARRAAILGDATQVHQMVANLASNAIQAMPGGGTLRLELAIERLEAPRAATIGGCGAGEYVVLTVADTGAGIAPEIIDRIFDPFFTTKEVGTGTGLGLSLVHGIVTDLGGAIDIASKVGTGSTFTIYLPRSGDAAELGEKMESALPRGDGQRVLVVDDEEPLVQLATRTLADLGYAPTGFTSSAAALEAFRADPERFDALITDERMPEMSGSALIREVRSTRSSIPVVLMSGYLGGTAGEAASTIGADEVLQKPLSARDLATSLAKVLRL